MYTSDDLKNELATLPWDDFRVLVLHASLSKIGRVEGGAEAVVAAFCNVANEHNVTLMMPAFTFSFVSMNGNFHYQHASTPSCVGAISEAFRTQPDAVCSFHPSHRAAAIGPLAHDLTRDHLASSPLGPGSPFHRITEHDAHVMLLGCDHISNSMLHVAEAMAPRCYLNVGPMLPDSSEPIEATEIATLEYANRKTVEIKFYDVPRCSRGFGAAEPVLRDRDLITDARLGDAPVQLMPASDTLAAILDTLTTTPDLLLCHSPDCLVCPPRRTWLRK